MKTHLFIAGIFLLGALGAGVRLSAQEQDPQPKKITSFVHGGKTVDIYEVGHYISSETNMDKFALEAGKVMNEITSQRGVETCAVICKSPEGTALGVRITTAFSKAACPITDACVSGFEVTDEDIHTHVPTMSYIPNDVDRVFLKGVYEKGQKVLTDPYVFSETDLNNKGGYLIQDKSLMHQNGHKHITTITVF